jgi:hypothetical protein
MAAAAPMRSPRARGTVELGLCAGEEILALNTKMIGLILLMEDES